MTSMRDPGDGRQLPERGGITVAEHGALTARVDGGQPPPFDPELFVAECIDARVQLKQPFPPDAMIYRLPA